MEQKDKISQEAECDDWDSRTVDIWDSVSAVADSPKERKRIDHWRSMCELMDIDTNIDTGA
jgi:hypothetical protein